MTTRAKRRKAEAAADRARFELTRDKIVFGFELLMRKQAAGLSCGHCEMEVRDRPASAGLSFYGGPFAVHRVWSTSVMQAKQGERGVSDVA
ncbi:MAG: hypothetical protein ACTHK3_02975 [Solirubrobacterales bacterium]